MAKTDWTINDEVTPQDMNDLGHEVNQIREDLDNIDVPPASTTKAGIVQLSNAVDSDSETLAATPKAVKQAYDHAEQAFQLGNERKSDLVDALIAIGVPASTGESWDSLLAKVGSVIRATGNADAGDVRAGRTFSNDSANGLVGNLPTRTGGNVVPGPSDIVKAAGIYDVPITVKGVPVPVDKVLAGTTIAGQAGTMPNRGNVSATLTQQGQEYTIQQGHHGGGGKVKAQFSNLTPPNIRDGVNIGGVVGQLKPDFKILPPYNISNDLKYMFHPNYSKANSYCAAMTPDGMATVLMRWANGIHVKKFNETGTLVSENIIMSDHGYTPYFDMFPEYFFMTGALNWAQGETSTTPGRYNYSGTLLQSHSNKWGASDSNRIIAYNPARNVFAYAYGQSIAVYNNSGTLIIAHQVNTHTGATIHAIGWLDSNHLIIATYTMGTYVYRYNSTVTQLSSDHSHTMSYLLKLAKMMHFGRF